jgi:hypothetical protein
MNATYLFIVAFPSLLMRRSDAKITFEVAVNGLWVIPLIYYVALQQMKLESPQGEVEIVLTGHYYNFLSNQKTKGQLHSDLGCCVAPTRTRFEKSALKTDPIVCPGATRWSVKFRVEGPEGMEEVGRSSMIVEIPECLRDWICRTRVIQ